MARLISNDGFIITYIENNAQHVKNIPPPIMKTEHALSSYHFYIFQYI